MVFPSLIALASLGDESEGLLGGLVAVIRVLMFSLIEGRTEVVEEVVLGVLDLLLRGLLLQLEFLDFLDHVVVLEFGWAGIGWFGLGLLFGRLLLGIDWRRCFFLWH